MSETKILNSYGLLFSISLRALFSLVMASSRGEGGGGSGRLRIQRTISPMINAKISTIPVVIATIIQVG